jgi:hypothetical protein
MTMAPQYNTYEVREETQHENGRTCHPTLCQEETAKKDEPEGGTELAAEPASAVPMESPGSLLFVRKHQEVYRPLGRWA